MRVWSFRGAFYGCVVGGLVGGLVAFIDFVTPDDQPSIVNVESSGWGSGFGGAGGGDYSGSGSFGSTTPAQKLAGLALGLDGEEAALQILTDHEHDLSERLFAITWYLDRSKQPTDAVIAAIDATRERLDQGWQPELNRHSAKRDVDQGASTRIDDLAWELDLASTRVNVRIKLAEAYEKVGRSDAAKGVVDAAEPDLLAYDQAMRAYNTAVAESHRQPEMSITESHALWPAVLSAFGFILTGISRPVLDAIGGGVVKRSQARSETKV